MPEAALARELACLRLVRGGGELGGGARRRRDIDG